MKDIQVGQVVFFAAGATVPYINQHGVFNCCAGQRVVVKTINPALRTAEVEVLPQQVLVRARFEQLTGVYPQGAKQ